MEDGAELPAAPGGTRRSDYVCGELWVTSLSG